MLTEQHGVRVAALMEDPPEQPLRPGDSVELDPCVNEETLAMYEEQHGRPCPRVELDPANATAANILGLELQSRQAIAVVYGQAALAEDGPAEVKASSLRALATLDNSEVQEELEAARERAAPRSEPARGQLRAPVPFGKRGRRRR